MAGGYCLDDAGDAKRLRIACFASSIPASPETDRMTRARQGGADESSQPTVGGTLE